jgi:hypothetical protein
MKKFITMFLCLIASSFLLTACFGSSSKDDGDVSAPTVYKSTAFDGTIVELTISERALKKASGASLFYQLKYDGTLVSEGEAVLSGTILEFKPIVGATFSATVGSGGISGFSPPIPTIRTGITITISLESPDHNSFLEYSGLISSGSVGLNELAGKTMYRPKKKIEFKTDGMFVKSHIKHYNTPSDPDNLDETGKYKYIPEQEGHYSWNADDKTVTLKLEKFGTGEEDTEANLLNWEQYRAFLEEGNNWSVAELTAMGLNKNEAIDLSIAMISSYTIKYKYVIDSDGILFMQKRLPETSKGTNELAVTGKTFTRVEWKEDTNAFVPKSDTYVLSHFENHSRVTFLRNC